MTFFRVYVYIEDNIYSLRKEEIMEDKKFYPLSNDRVFKTMMRSKNFQKWFKEIILEKLGIDLSNFELLSEESVEGEEIKEYRLDTLLKDIENNYVIIEMQNTYADYKNLRYLYRVAGNVVSKGIKDSDILSNVILIQLDGYINNIYKGIEKDILHFVLKEEELNIEKPGIEVYEILLPKFEEKRYNEIDKRLGMFMCKNFNVLQEYATSKESKVVVKELEMLCMDEKFRFAMKEDEYRALEIASAKKYGYDEGLETGRESGLAEGLEKGESNANRKVIASMISENYKDEEILKIFKITQEELDEIKKSISSNE